MSLQVSFTQKPPKFKGRATEDIDGFLAKLNAYFGHHTGNLTDNDKAYIVCQCLEETALGWVKVQLENYPNTLIGATGAWPDYDAFMTHIRSMHKRYYDPKQDAERKLLNYKQGKSSILTYNQEFMNLRTRLNSSEWKDGPLLAIYKKGLNEHIHNRLAGQTGSTKWKLDDWMENAKHVEREEYNLKSKNQWHVPQWNEVGRSREPRYEPMDVDVDKRTFNKPFKRKFKKPFKPRAFKKKNTSFTCNYCGKPGHYANTCRMNPQRKDRVSSNNNNDKNKSFKRKAINGTASEEEGNHQSATIEITESDEDF